MMREREREREKEKGRERGVGWRRRRRETEEIQPNGKSQFYAFGSLLPYYFLAVQRKSPLFEPNLILGHNGGFFCIFR